MKPYIDEVPREGFRFLGSLRYESTCARCQDPVLVGQSAWWHRKMRLVVHPECFGSPQDPSGVQVLRSPVVLSSGLPSLGRRR
jgi:hypothetical protein